MILGGIMRTELKNMSPSEYLASRSVYAGEEEYTKLNEGLRKSVFNISRLMNLKQRQLDEIAINSIMTATIAVCTSLVIIKSVLGGGK